jgi:hypothetical protein
MKLNDHFGGSFKQTLSNYTTQIPLWAVATVWLIGKKCHGRNMVYCKLSFDEKNCHGRNMVYCKLSFDEMDRNLRLPSNQAEI